MVPRGPIILAACAALTVFVPATARAGTAIRLQTAGDLPFTAEELEQAVGARVAMSADSGAALVTVGPSADAGVQLRMGDRQTVVAVAGHAGRAAARVVALAIAELAADAGDDHEGDDEDDQEGENDDDEPDVRRPPPETGPTSIAAQAALSPAASTSPRISVAFGTLKGYRDVQPFNLTGEADVAFPRNGFDLIGGVGVWDQPTTQVGTPAELSLLAGVVRAGAGWRTGPAQLVVGAFLAPYRIEGPAIHHTGALFGAGAMVRVGHRFSFASNIEVFGSLRVDAFANQVRLTTPNEYPTFETPRLAAAAALGVAWDLGI